MDNQLTTEDQRILTEWLGECWHVPNHMKENGTYSTADRCCFCGAPLPWILLDFSDWRVVGRLVEKLQTITTNADMVRLEVRRALFSPSPRLAICRAVLAYLKEGEKK